MMTWEAWVDELRDMLDRWVGAGILSRDQASSIEEIEAGRASSVATTSDSPSVPVPTSTVTASDRRSLLAEVFGYLGAVVAFASLGVVLAGQWDDLSTAVQLLLPAVASVALIALGAMIPTTDPALRRLGRFLWLLGVLAVGAFGLVLADRSLEETDPNVALIAGSVAAVVALVLLLARPAALQHIALAGSLAVAVVGLATQYDEAGADVIGTALWGLGAVLFLLSWGRVLPDRDAGEVVAAVVMLGGAQTVAVDRPAAGLWLGLLTAIALLVGGAMTRRRGLVTVGVVGLVVLVPQIAVRAFGGDGDTGDAGTGQLLVAFGVGIAAIAAAVVLARRSRSPGGRSVT